MTRPLIDPDHLRARLDDPALRVVDVRWYLDDPERGRREYRQGHLPGAVFCDLEDDLTADEGPGRHPLPDPGAFCTTLGRLGIGPGNPVVAYDASGGAVAARLWWMLRSIGHHHVAVLDGGYPAWVEAGHPTTDVVPRVEEVYYPPAERWRGTVDRDDVRRKLGAITLVDARAAERYRGETEPVDPRAGHIPTAVNLPYAGNLDDDGRMLPPDALRRRFEEVAGPDTVLYCGSGVTAAHDILAMTVAGLPVPSLYPGSWSDWSSYPELPAVTGDEPGSP